MSALEQKLTAVKPSAKQLSWQETEFYAFIHYGINQFTGREWGTGDESPGIFDPKELDTDKWCEAMTKAGMRGAIITAKHHDGFCLWDTKHTRHSVMNSPYGKDIVAQLSQSCRNYDMKLGIYLSPWDRHDERYGQGKPYDDYFCDQLTELLGNYGDVFSVWFDGACGEGPNGKVQVYDWDRYYSIIRQMQPNAVIAVCGPDVRWCGNEAGHCRKSEWSVVSATMADNERIKENSQQADNKEFRKRFPSDEDDLGSRKALKDVENLIWYPAEVNTSIRPGWFYHQEEDDKVRSLESLSDIYIQSVGGNATFLLNIPPHPQGYFTHYDVDRLEELGNWIRDSFNDNLLTDAIFTASSEESEKPASGINAQGSYWKSSEADISPVIEVDACREISPRYLILQEEITQSQRIEDFILYYKADSGVWKPACSATVVGYKRICPIEDKISARYWKLCINSCRLGATLKTFSLS